MIDEPKPVFAYRPHLDGLRAVAVLLVFIFHAAPSSLPGGFIGVDVFFVLSGFLITSILLRQVDAGTASLLDFYRRRFQRLLPAAFVLLLTVIAAESIWGSVIEATTRRREAISTVFYVANWNLIDQADDYFAEGFAPSPLRHMWSLAIEEQFYLFWPIFVVVGLRLLNGRLGIFAACIASVTVVSALLMVVSFSPTEASRVYYGTDTRVFQPLAGALLAVIVHASTKSARISRALRCVRPFSPAASIGAFIALIALGWSFGGTGSTYFRGGAIAVTVISVVLILGTEQPGALRTVLSHRWVVALGAISYGFYLWHWPIILWLSPPDEASWTDRRLINLLQFAATVAIAVASYRLVEQPLRTLRRPKTSSVFVAAGLSMAVATLVAFILLSPPPLTNATAEEALEDRSVFPCKDGVYPCVRSEGAGSSPPTVALVGDSTAQHYDLALRQLSADYGFRYVQAAAGGCPIGNRLLATGTGAAVHKPSNLKCHASTKGVYERLVTEFDVDLVLATSFNETSQHVTDGAVVTRNTPQHFAETREYLDEAVDDLAAGGAEIAFIEIVPRGPGVQCLESSTPNSGDCITDITNAFERRYNEILREAASASEHVAGTLTVESSVCPNESCPLILDGVVARYDGTHFTGTQSLRMAPILRDALAEVGINLGNL